MSFELFLPLFCRMIGIFLLSPLFSRFSLPMIFRLSLSIALTFLFLPFVSVGSSKEAFGCLLIRETIIGYLMGFLFSLVIEAAALGGQLIGVLAGFSATELLDPLRSSSFPLWSRLFVLFAGAWMFFWDFHLEIIRLLHQSLLLFPLNGDNWKNPLLATVVKGGSYFFHAALHFAAFPLATLSLVVILLAFMAKILPDLPVFWVGLPFQLFFGMALMIIAAPLFPEILLKAFFEIKELFERIFLNLLLFL